MISHGKRLKIIHNPTVLDFDGNIYWYSRRYKCKICGTTQMEENPFTFSGMQESYSLMRRVMVELRNPNYTYYDIAQRLHVSPTTVQRYADSWIVIPRQKLTESIGIDEYHSPVLGVRGSSYLCIIVDNVGRKLLEVLPSRKKEYLLKYFKGIPLDERKTVKYVTIDMWEAYRDVAKEVFPNCIVAVDPFHVVKDIGTAFTKYRVRLMNQYPYDSNGYYLLKKWHRLLETDICLDNEPKYNHRFKAKVNYRDIFNMLLELNSDFTKAYRLKEKYRAFNKNCTYEDAREELDALILECSHISAHEFSGIPNMLYHWKEEIINSFLRPYDDRKLSNSLSENINGKINTYVNISRGLSNFQRFRNRMIFAFNDSVFYSITEFLSSLKQKKKPRGKYKK